MKAWRTGRGSHVEHGVEEGRKLLEVVQHAEARYDGVGLEVEANESKRDASNSK